jgi:hypothetical protein
MRGVLLRLLRRLLGIDQAERTLAAARHAYGAGLLRGDIGPVRIVLSDHARKQARGRRAVRPDKLQRFAEKAWYSRETSKRVK